MTPSTFRRIALVLGGRLHDRLVAVHGHEARAAILELTNGRTDRCRDVEELEIAEHFLVALEHPVEQLEVAAAHHQLEADLVERHRIAELVGERACAVAVRNVHGEDQAVPVRNVFVLHLGLGRAVDSA